MSRRGRTLGLLAAVVVLIFAFTAQIRRGESLPVPPSMVMVVARQPAAPARPGVHIYDPDPAQLWNRLHASIFVRVAADVPSMASIASTRCCGPARHTCCAGRRTTKQSRPSGNSSKIDRRDALIREPRKRTASTAAGSLDRIRLAARRARAGPPAGRNSGGRAQECRRAERIARDGHHPVGARARRHSHAPGQLRGRGAGGRSSARPLHTPADRGSRSAGPTVRSPRFTCATAARARTRCSWCCSGCPPGATRRWRSSRRFESFRQPLWVQDYPNPALPPFPAGTQVALVRRALLIDTSGQKSRRAR